MHWHDGISLGVSPTMDTKIGAETPPAPLNVWASLTLNPHICFLSPGKYWAFVILFEPTNTNEEVFSPFPS